MDELFDISLDSQEIQNDKEWETLVDQVVKRNVIPIIGDKMVSVEGKTSRQFLIDSVAGMCGIKDSLASFSELIFHPLFELKFGRKNIYKVLTKLIDKYPAFFKPTPLLTTVLSLKEEETGLPYFPFVITTTIDPIVENTMRGIYGDSLRVLSFCNNPMLNDDIKAISDVTSPTLYYIFGHANNNARDMSFVASDTDYLRFARSWLSPTDSNNRSKPNNLSKAMADKYLLAMGCEYQDWLFRFIWYALKEDRLTDSGSSSLGAMTNNATDEELISFLTRSNTFAHIDDFAHFASHLAESLREHQPKQNDVFARPASAPHVFISYSRANSDVAQCLYETLKRHGVSVWYDRENLGAGINFMQQIERSIHRATLFVPILSTAIAEQAMDIHPYRQEWEWAIYKEKNTGGARYIVPLCEKVFERHLEDEKADIPQALLKHNVCTYQPVSLQSDIENISLKLIDILRSDYGIEI